MSLPMKSPLPPRAVVITSVKPHGANYVVTGTVDGTETITHLNKRQVDAAFDRAAQRRMIAEALAREVPQEHDHLCGPVTV